METARADLGYYLKRTREYLNIGQETLAAELGVSFATVNRWENGHNAAENSAQQKLYDFCISRVVPVYDFVMERIAAEEASLEHVKGHGFFYHGSRSGIEGRIAPISRPSCDFGPGFYMGSEAVQPLSLVSEYPTARFYIADVDFNLTSLRILEPGIDWALFIAYCRGKLENIRGSALYQKYASLAEGRDLIIGNIADDRIFSTLKQFFDGQITDTALTESITQLKMGLQCVAVSQHGCNCISIAKEIELLHFELLVARRQAEIFRAEGKAIADEACIKYRRVGRYFDEILKEADNG